MNALPASKAWLAVLAAVCAMLGGCRREARDFRPAPPFSGSPAEGSEFEQSAYALSEGKWLFIGMNCQGCHGLGGGGMGPALMDAEWIYGYEPEQVFETISRGRSNGMPAFGGPEGCTPGVTVAGTLPRYQIWQLVAYVRSLSGLASKTAAPARSDHMKSKPPESDKDPESPVGEPPK